MTHRTERRRHPRVKADLGLRVGTPGREAAARVHDVSPSGIRCLTDEGLPVMTQVRVHLEIPTRNGARTIACTGVVVRSERQSRDTGHETAIFFTEVAEADRSELEAFVLRSHAAAS